MTDDTKQTKPETVAETKPNPATQDPVATPTKRAYFFPHAGKTVHAESLEEAEKLIKNISE